MKKLWLTYAWSDNDDQSVDHVLSKLSQQDLQVEFDRQTLVPGRRIWPQIDASISDPTKSDAWAILVTRNSLNSEACLEELAYALDRALRSRGSDFPIIGIFPAPLDRALIPSAIASRLYVHLTDPTWAERVAAGVRGERPPTKIVNSTPVVAFHKLNEKNVVELRPRSGRWYPCIVAVPADEVSRLEFVQVAPYGPPTGNGLVHLTKCDSPDGQWKGICATDAADPLRSAFAYFTSLPSRIQFGTQSELHTIDISL